MEKKTIGGFISALRKANGMTQKDLAERLNVSDKTISRWECDESTPDLSLIPVIAEIFVISCDELLRGERKSPELRSSETSAEEEHSPKAEKQRQLILKSTLLRFQTSTYVAILISVVGQIEALVCNLAFLKAVLGFLLGALFFTASIVLQITFLTRALFSVDDEEFRNLPGLNDFKRSVIHLTLISIGLTVCLIGFTLPLAMMDAYVGLSANNMLFYGLIGMAIFLLIYGVIWYFLNAHFLKRGVYTLEEKALQRYRHNHRLKMHCAIVLLVLLAITGGIHTVITSIYGPYSIMEGITFTDHESFAAFMEQDIPVDILSYNYYNGSVAEEMVASLVDSPETDDSHIIYYDENGNIITEEEALRRTIVDADGNILCEYLARNKSVIHIRYGGNSENGYLPITVYTQESLNAARNTAAVRHIIFIAVYLAEVLLVLLFYFSKRAKK